MPAISCRTGSGGWSPAESSSGPPDPSDRRKVIYALTAKGEGLLPVVLALRQWGEQWGHGKPGVVLADHRDGKPVRKICVLSHDGRELGLDDLTWIDVEGERLPLNQAAE